MLPSVTAEWIWLRLLNVPNRDRATTRGQRSVAQMGQNSAPMNSTSGLPAELRGGPLMACSGYRLGTEETADVSVPVDTPVTLVTWAAGAAARLPVVVDLPPDRPTVTMTTTTAITTTTDTRARSWLRRRRACQAAWPPRDGGRGAPGRADAAGRPVPGRPPPGRPFLEGRAGTGVRLPREVPLLLNCAS